MLRVDDELTRTSHLYKQQHFSSIHILLGLRDSRLVRSNDDLDTTHTLLVPPQRFFHRLQSTSHNLWPVQMHLPSRHVTILTAYVRRHGSETYLYAGLLPNPRMFVT